MREYFQTILYVSALVLMISAIYLMGCKKIDLKRIAAVTTQAATNISQTTAEANGNVIDLGTNLTDHGFCWKSGTIGEPTINDNKESAGNTAKTGAFSLVISGLQQNTNYQLRSYVSDEAGVTYGETLSFKTLQQIIGDWLHYDDGANADGIGYTSGGSFDVAIRFPKEDLIQYAGAGITKIKFFPREAGIEYFVTIYEGDDPDLMLLEKVTNPTIGAWTEFNLPGVYPIDISKDLWVGYWIVNHPEGTYPAGVDDGPAVTGLGDLISSDNGETWEALSEIDPPNLDYNWNLQVYVGDIRGEVVLIQRKHIKRSYDNNGLNEVDEKTIRSANKHKKN